MSSENQRNKKYILQYRFWGFIEFLLSGDEIKNTGTMTEVTVPVPPFRPSA